MRKRHLLFLVLLAAGTVAEADARAADRLNVLFIAVDDMNDWVGAMGNTQAKTPHIDRLARGGVVFRNAHTAATYCTPSRTALMTGLYPSTTGCYGEEVFFHANPEWTDLPAYFKAHGYKTRGGGKLYHHMPGYVDQRGWDDFFFWKEANRNKGWCVDSWGEGAPNPPRRPNSPATIELMEQLKARGQKKDVTSFLDYAALPNELEEKMADTLCANWAVGLLKQRHEKPFFLGFGLYAPHKPNYAPKKYFDLYPLADLELPPLNEDDLDDLPPQALEWALRRKRHGYDRLVRNNCLKECVQGYLAAISYADAMIGRVLTALDASPYANNTIVVLWSDNGYHNREKMQWAKHTLWERTSNVPLIFAGPGIAPGVVDTPVSLVDVYPTLVDLCGLPRKAGLDGVSLKGTLTSPRRAKDRTVFEMDAHGTAVIAGNWHYIRYVKGDEEELYSMRDDPRQWTNLAADPKFAKRLEKMRAMLPKRAPVASGSARPAIRLVSKEGTFEWVKSKRKK
jgi:choline-sulfatase